MFEEAENNSLDHPAPPSDKSAILRYVLLAAAALYVIASLYLMYDMRTRLLTLEQKQLATEVAQEELGKRLHATSSEFKQALTTEVGTTKQEMAERAAELELSRRLLPPSCQPRRTSKASSLPRSAAKLAE